MENNTNQDNIVLAHENARELEQQELDQVSGGAQCSTKLTWSESSGSDAEASCSWEF